MRHIALLLTITLSGLGMACTAQVPTDIGCAAVRDRVEAPYADADYRDGAWHFPDGVAIQSPEEDSCWTS